MTFEMETRSPEETEKIGEIIGQQLVGGEIIALDGDLGTGKTTFICGVARGLDIPESEITSPTFIFLREHRGRLPMAHLDLYRIDSGNDLPELGITDYLNPPWVVVIEWAERAEVFLEGMERLRIKIEDGSEQDQRRRIKFNFGQAYAVFINSLKGQFAV